MEEFGNKSHPLVAGDNHRGFLDWADQRRLWEGHSGNYAAWIRDHPACDPSSPAYDLAGDTCLAAERAEEDEEKEADRKFAAEPIQDEIMDELQYLEDEVVREYGGDELNYDILVFERDKTFPHAYKVLIAMRYIISILCIGVPWLVYGFLGIVWNIVLNAWLNEGWAEGNFFLLANTCYVLIQTPLSWLLYLEVYPYMHWFALVRLLSVMAAIWYNLAYFTFLAAWLSEVYFLPFVDDEEIAKMGAVDVFMNMFFVYNSVLHAPVCILNAAIIFKEALMLVWSVITNDPVNSAVSGGTSEYALNWKRAKEALWDDLWWLDPMRSLPKVIWYVFKLDLTELFEKTSWFGL